MLFLSEAFESNERKKCKINLVVIVDVVKQLHLCYLLCNTTRPLQSHFDMPLHISCVYVTSPLL